MFFLTLVKVVPFQLFLLLPNVLFDQASPVPFHLLSYGGKGGGDLSNVLFQPGQFAPSYLCLWGEGELQMFFLNSGSLYLLTSACGEGGGGILNVPFKPRQIVSFHLCLREGGGIFTDFSLWGLHNVLIHSFYLLHNLLLLYLNPFL